MYNTTHLNIYTIHFNPMDNKTHLNIYTLSFQSGYFAAFKIIARSTEF